MKKFLNWVVFFYVSKCVVVCCRQQCVYSLVISVLSGLAATIFVFLVGLYGTSANFDFDAVRQAVLENIDKVKFLFYLCHNVT